MSDTAASQNDLARKRSRSSSPNASNDAPAAAKKANTDASGPSNLTVDDNLAIPSAAVDTGSKNGDDSKTDSKTTGGENPAPMAVDTELPANPEKAAAAAAASAAAPEVGPTAQIQMRALIVTQDASIIIGKGGKNVNEIREKSGSKITITESVPGNPERVMVIGGQLDAVSKAFGLIVRRINDEPFDVPSVPGSRAVTIRFIIPNARMGSVIGKGGAKIKEIQEASGARLQASEAMLPGSTERVLSVSGVADAIHIAVYYVGTILQEHPVATISNTAYRPMGGVRYGYEQGPAAYGVPGQQQAHMAPQVPRGPPMPIPGAQTQQIFIPNELVGSIIGKGGAKINEVRQLSQCQIKINEPGEGVPGGTPQERLVTITGQPAGIQIAVRMLYERLESEKQKQIGGL